MMKALFEKLNTKRIFGLLPLILVVSFSLIICKLPLVGSGNKNATNAYASTVIVPVSESVDDFSWVKETNIYEIYVKSFGADSHNLQGVTNKLDYLEKLGVKTIWLMPVFAATSPHGYDTTDYYAIAPDYGTADDLKNLVEAAHKKGMRVILDLVMNHCGINHPWFSSPNASERKDSWFIWDSTDLAWPDPWTDCAKDDCSQDASRGKTWFKDSLPELDRNHNGDPYDDDYLYSVFGDKGVTTQPDFNFNNPTSKTELMDEFENIMRFWIQKTDIDGFRCDAVRYIVENGKGEQKDQPETHAIWKDMRKRLAQIKPSAIMLAEAPTEDPNQMIEYYGKGDEFHSAFHFNYQGVLINTLKNEYRTSDLMKELYNIQGRLPSGTQDTIFLNNHDRFAGDRVATQLHEEIYKMKSVASLYLLLSGNPAIYYGEEIGMPNDPSKEKDEAIRQPMDWNTAKAQENTSDSILNHYRRLLKIRNNYDALRGGITYFVPTHFNDEWDSQNSESKMLSIIREFYGEKILVVHNFSSSNQTANVDLTQSGLTISSGSEVYAVMGGGNYPVVSDSNKNYYPLGTVYGFTTKVLFLGDISKYKDSHGKFVTYENALELAGLQRFNSRLKISQSVSGRNDAYFYHHRN